MSKFSAFARGFLQTDINRMQEEDAQRKAKAEKYENALFTLQVEGQKQRMKAHQEKTAAWEGINRLKDQGMTLDALNAVTSMNGLNADIYKTLKFQTGAKDGDSVALSKEGKAKADAYLTDLYNQFKAIKAPTMTLDRSYEIEARRAAEDTGFAGFLNNFGVNKDHMNIPPTVGSQASRIHQQLVEQDQAFYSQLHSTKSDKAFDVTDELMVEQDKEANIEYKQMKMSSPTGDVLTEYPIDKKTGKILSMPVNIMDVKNKIGYTLSESEQSLAKSRTWSRAKAMPEGARQNNWLELWDHPEAQLAMMGEAKLLAEREGIFWDEALNKIWKQYDIQLGKDRGVGWDYDPNGRMVVLPYKKQVVSVKGVK